MYSVEYQCFLILKIYKKEKEIMHFFKYSLFICSLSPRKSNSLNENKVCISQNTFSRPPLYSSNEIYGLQVCILWYILTRKDKVKNKSTLSCTFFLVAKKCIQQLQISPCPKDELLICQIIKDHQSGKTLYYIEIKSFTEMWELERAGLIHTLVGYASGTFRFYLWWRL